MSFTKPHLGRFQFGPENSTANNILFEGTTAVGFLDDHGHEPNASRRFKAWGNLAGSHFMQGGGGGGNANARGGAAGPDGRGSSTSGVASGSRSGSAPNASGTPTAPATTGSGSRYGYTAQLAGSAVSANGLNFTDYRRLQNASSSKTVRSTLRFDAQTSLFFDARKDKYVMS